MGLEVLVAGQVLNVGNDAFVTGLLKEQTVFFWFHAAQRLCQHAALILRGKLQNFFQIS